MFRIYSSNNFVLTFSPSWGEKILLDAIHRQQFVSSFPSKNELKKKASINILIVARWWQIGD